MEGTAQVEFCASQNWTIHVVIFIYVCTRESIWNPDSNTLEPERLKHDCPATRVIAQQYSSATFVSLRFRSR